MEEQILRLKHAQLHPSEENRPMRSGMDDKSIGELAQSIMEQGIIQPLIIRTDKATGQYEIIAGERRWRAYGVAMERFKIKDGAIPCIFRELTDSKIRQQRLIENVQREGIHPIEEAAGYKELLEMVDDQKRPLHTINKLAEEIGKSVAFIYGRIKLLDMPDIAQQAMIAGKLNASVALLISRIPDPKQARKATLEVLEQYGNNHDEKIALDENVEPMSYREAKDHISRKYMVRLKGAPFDQKDENLVPIYYTEGSGSCGGTAARQGGGACTTCPFRTGNMKAHGVETDSADVCTNTVCFKKKKDATFKAEKEAADKEGSILLTENQSKRVLNYDGTALDSSARGEWVDIRETIPGKKKTWEDALEKFLPEDTKVTLARGKKNFLLLPVPVVAEAAKAAKIKFEKPKVTSSPRYGTPEYEEQERLQIEKRTTAQAIAQAAHEQLLEKIKEKSRADQIRREGHVAIIFGQLEGKEYKEAVEKFKSMTQAEIDQALFTNAYMDPRNYLSYQGDFTDQLIALCKEFGVDLKAIAKQIKSKPAEPTPEEKK